MEEVREVKTLYDLQHLYEESAMTWEGLSEDSFEEAFKACGTGASEMWVTKGKTMNKLCRLTGDNAYPDDLTIFSITNFRGLAIFYGARWMDDIITNNAEREGYHPFLKIKEEYEEE